MKKSILASVFGLLPLLAAAPAQAVIGALDPVPAATLLLPYFEVDLDNPSGVNTVVAVANADQAPVIVHVTLWTDLGVPTLDWNMYLTGYDVVRIDLRELFTTGTTPATEHINDGDAISPVGSFSLVTDPVTGVGPGSTSCNGQLPLPPLPSSLLAHIGAAHRGLASAVFAGLCAGRTFGDNTVRGYLTFDSANFCSLDFPGDIGYFVQGGTGAANNKNALLGDFAVTNPAAGRSHGDTLVHLEADAELAASSYTFYRRFSGGADNREPLPTSFWARFSTAGTLSETRLVVWRDPKRGVSPFACGVTPAPYPLGQNQIAVFDEDENAELQDINPFPWAANNVRLNGTGFPVTPSAGWLYLNLNAPVAGSSVPFEPVMQNYVGITKSGAVAGGAVSLGLLAFPLDSALEPVDLNLPVCDGTPDPAGCGSLPLFTDGFESGDTSAWSLTVP